MDCNENMTPKSACGMIVFTFCPIDQSLHLRGLHILQNIQIFM